MPTDTQSEDPKACACAYLLTGLFQRLETARPGLIAELLQGVRGDRANTPPNVLNREFIDKAFEEAETILKRAGQFFSGEAST